MNNRYHFDVIIVGAGPSGCAAAIRLLEKGLRVVVLDKHGFPRTKICGDGLTTASLRLLERLQIDPRQLPSWRSIRSTVWRAPSGFTITLPVSNDGERMGSARRDELDLALLQRVTNAGAAVLQNHKLVKLNIDNDGVEAVAENGRALRASYLIAADGAWSTTRKLVQQSSRERYLGDIHAFRQYAENVSGVCRDAVWVSFEKDLLPGYFWSFPSGKRGANIGFGVQRNAGNTMNWMKSKWCDLLERPHIRNALGDSFTIVDTPKAWPIPASLSRATLCDATGHVLFVGDAARAVDPLTGEGIGQAIHTALCAAEAILDAGPDDRDRAMRTYTRHIASGLLIDNQFARLLTRVVARPWGAELAIRLANKGPQKGRYAIRWVLEDNPRAGLITPWRWRDRFLSKTGAFIKET